MTQETKNNCHPEGGIYELFAYLPKLGVYQNSLDMNELYEMSLIIRHLSNWRH